MRARAIIGVSGSKSEIKKWSHQLHHVVSDVLLPPVKVKVDGLYLEAVGKNETIEYKYMGKLHRVGAPALIRAGVCYWYENGHLHREDGPAIESEGGSQWFFKGIRHREDGPARVWKNGHKEYWLGGKLLSHEEWLDRVMSDETRLEE